MVEPTLVVAIGMHASHLCEHIVSNDGLIGRDGYAAVAFHQTADVVEPFFVDVSLGMKMILQNDLYAGERRITAPLPQPIHRDVQSAHTAERCCQRVRDGQVVVVVGMKIEVSIGIAAVHLTEKLNDLQRIHDAERIRQHEAAHRGVDECVHQLIYIFGRVLHAARPVFQIQIDLNAFAMGIGHFLPNVADVLLGSLPQLLTTVLERPLCQQVERFATGTLHPVHRHMSVNETQHFHAVQTVYLTGIATYHLHSLFLAFAHPCRTHLNAIHIQVAQQHAGYHELLVRQKAHPARLLAVAQRRVHDFNKGLEPVHVLHLFHSRY